MEIYAKNYKNGYIREFNVNNFQELDSLCAAYGIQLRFEVESEELEHHKEAIKEAFKKVEIKRDIIFCFEKEYRRKPDGKSYLEKIDMIFDDVNNIYKLNSEMDKDLLGQMLIFRCYYDVHVVKFLLNPLSLNYFSNTVAQEAFELLITIPTLPSLHYAQELLNSKHWNIRGDGI